jgi:hypothetical protein
MTTIFSSDVAAKSGAPRGLILTVACSYGPAQLAPFVESWKRNVPNADLVVIAGNLPEETDRYLSESNVIVVPADFNRHTPTRWRKAWHRLHTVAWLRFTASVYRWFGTRPDEPFYHHIAEASFHLYSQRFFHYRRYLAHFGWKYSHALLVDCRDTVFQASPFPCEGLHVFAENECVGTSHFAKRWFQLSYGNHVFKQLSAFPLLCAGVTLGDTASMRKYLEINCSESLRISAVNDVDQAVHNFLIHRELISAVRHAFGEGPAINLNATPLSSLNVINGKLCDASDQPFPIVHQYDRVRGLELVDLHPRPESTEPVTSTRSVPPLSVA